MSNRGGYRQPDSKFLVQGTVTNDPYQGPNYSFAVIRDGEKLYLDVTCWEDGPLAEFRNMRGGNVVRIEGDLGKRKVKDSDPPRYELALVARRVTFAQMPGGMPSAGPPPSRPAPRPQYQGPGPVTYPQWTAQQQPQAPQPPMPDYWAQQPRAQQPQPQGQPQAEPLHPAQFDANDDLTFPPRG